MRTLRRSKVLVRQLWQRRQFQIETRKPLPLQLSSTVPLPPPKELLIPPDHNDLFVTKRNGQSMLRYQIPNMRRFAQVFAEARRVCREDEYQYIEANRLQYNERYRSISSLRRNTLFAPGQSSHEPMFFVSLPQFWSAGALNACL